jgi:hypothetical protein
MMRTLITAIAVGLAVVAWPAAAAEAREPVARAEVSAAAHRLANQSAAELEDHSARGVEDLTNGAASVDRSRTSVGNYLRYGKFRMGASFALFGPTPSTASRTCSGASATSRSCGRRTATPASTRT